MFGLQSSLIRPTIRAFLVSRPLIFPSIHFKTQILPLKSPSKFRIFAADGSSNNTDPIPKEAIEKEQGQQQQPNGFFNGDGVGGGVGGGGGGGDGGGGGGGGGHLRIDRVLMFIFWWWDLLNPDPNNIVVVGSTGVLTWASVIFLRLIYFIFFGILLEALKYSIISALLVSCAALLVPCACWLFFFL